MAEEIERKFIIQNYENISQLIPSSFIEIEQNYLAIGEEEIRIRKIKHANNHQFLMTIKNGHGMVRKEQEFEITENTYKQIEKSLKKQAIKKRRYHSKKGNLIIIIDIYINIDLILLEIEFNSIDEAHDFKNSLFIGEEVTYNENFKNKNLWKSLNYK